MRCLFLLVLVLATACAPTATPDMQTYSGLGMEVLPGYAATFDLRFDGATDWHYLLETRTNSESIEYNLQLEGLSESRDPGDVRMVTTDKISRMRGPGTNDECLQFPSDQDLELSFLTPDDLIAPAKISEQLKALDTKRIAGVVARGYQLRQTNLGQWEQVEVDLWRDEKTGAVVQYDLKATGEDPLFNAGAGVLSGQFIVKTIKAQTIEPIDGCEIDLPLPKTATRLVKLPGLVAFDTTQSTAEIVSFYQAELAQASWAVVAEPETSEKASLLSYQQGERTLDINVETNARGAHVELWLEEAK
jgi:hypothetical protein